MVEVSQCVGVRVVGGGVTASVWVWSGGWWRCTSQCVGVRVVGGGGVTVWV